MNYFLTNKIVYINSGIEHAQNKRLKMFKRGNVGAKIVTHQFMMNGHRYIKSLNLMDEDVVNLFDFFGGTERFESKKLTLNDLKIPSTYQITQTGEGFDYQVKDGNTFKMLIRHDEYDVNKVGNIYYYDKNIKPIKKIFFDSRGFASVSLLMDFDGHKIIERYHRPDSSIYLEFNLDAENKDITGSRAIRLLDYNGKDYTFTEWNHLLSFFYDELNLLDPDHPSTFISDRSNLTDIPMMNMKSKAYKIEQLHYTHYEIGGNPETGRVMSYFLKREQWHDKISALTVASKRQKKDIEQRFKNVKNVSAIPVGVISNDLLKKNKISFKNRTNGSIVAVARPTEQKQLDQMIKAVAYAHEKNNVVHLDIYGVPAGVEGNDEWNRLNKLIETNQWDGFIHFHGYVNNLDEILDKAQLAMLTSREEGFGMALLEAMSHGVPLLSYNYNYGADDLIENDFNGYLVAQDDLDELKVRLDSLISDSKLLERLSKGSYEKSHEFSEDNILKMWNSLFQNIEMK